MPEACDRSELPAELVEWNSMNPMERLGIMELAKVKGMPIQRAFRACMAYLRHRREATAC